MIIPLPEQVESRLTAEDATLHLALGLFVDQRVTLGQAAEVAGISQSEFLRELGGRRISVHYDESDALADIATVRDWQQP
jgi:predicted HTH domain antitoxin